MGEDGAATDAVQSLQLTGCAEVVPLDVNIQEGEREDQCGEEGRRTRDDDQGEHSYHTINLKISMWLDLWSHLPLAELTKSILNVRLDRG